MRDDVYNKKANLLKALGHPLRLQIIDILNKEEITVTALCQRLQEEQANISRHLSILRKEEVIDFKKQGVNTFYYVKYNCLMSLNTCLDAVMKSRLKGEIEVLKRM